jgi:hypothetical protein
MQTTLPEPSLTRINCRRIEAKQLYEEFAVPTSGTPLFQAATANLNRWTEAKVDTETEGEKPAAHHLWRERRHRPVGHRQCQLSSATAK